MGILQKKSSTEQHGEPENRGQSAIMGLSGRDDFSEMPSQAGVSLYLVTNVLMGLHWRIANGLSPPFQE